MGQMRHLTVCRAETDPDRPFAVMLWVLPLDTFYCKLAEISQVGEVVGTRWGGKTKDTTMRSF